MKGCPRAPLLALSSSSHGLHQKGVFAFPFEIFSYVDIAREQAMSSPAPAQIRPTPGVSLP